ncbi:MAG TPA: hypothetical protein VKY56_05165 [Chloroflexota bacterium]|nr:hypothetical protein [Chloroflexota bacterium]
MSVMRNIEPGFRVVGSDGREVGTIASCTREYCEVDTGILGLGRPLFVPMDAIRQTDGTTIYLAIPGEQVAQMPWEQPPPGATAGCSTGGQGATMPAGQAAPAATAVSPALGPAALATARPGWPVICTEGRVIGKVSAVRPDGLDVERGWFIFRQRVRIPARAIRNIDAVERKVFLDVSCAAVDRFPAL